MAEPQYFARGLEVHKRPVHRRVGDKTHITVGFQVCTVSEWAGEEGAETIAAILSLNEALASAAPDDERGPTPEPGSSIFL